MRKFYGIVGVLQLVVVSWFSFSPPLHAQRMVAPRLIAPDPLTMTQVELSAAEVELIPEALREQPLFAPDVLPFSGTFYSLQYTNYPPLPGNILGLPCWSMGDGMFLLNDVTVDYAALRQKAQAATEQEVGMALGGSSGMMKLDGGMLPMALTYGSNDLWLEITGVTNSTAGLTLHGTTPDLMYEILSKEDLLAPVWQSEGMLWGAADQDWTATIVPLGVCTNYLFFWAQSWVDSENVGIPDWWQLQYFGYVGIDPYADSPAGDGFNIYSKYQSGLAPTNFVTPPAPSNFSAVLSTNGTDVLLSWNPAQGAVTNYAIERYVFNWNTFQYDHSPIGPASAAATSFTDVGVVTNGNPNNKYYLLTAKYPGDNSSSSTYSYIYSSPPAPPTPPTPVYNIDVSATLIRNATGRWQLMFSGLSDNAQAVRLIWGNAATETILTGSLTNGIYPISDADAVNHLGDTLSVQGMQTNGAAGAVVPVGALAKDAPYFVDGRQHLKQNLLFKLRAATLNRPCVVNETTYWAYWGFEYYYPIPGDTNYVESGFLHWAYSYDASTDYIALNNLWPFKANYRLHQRLYDTNSVAAEFSWQPDFETVPAPVVLGLDDPYWISQDVSDLPDLAITITGDPNFGTATLQNGAYNLFGLPIGTALVNTGFVVDPMTGLPTGAYTLSPGTTVDLTSHGHGVLNFFSQTPATTFQTVGYYFASLISPGMDWSASVPVSAGAQPYPLPVNLGFAATNQTPLMIAAVGKPVLIGGWAKQQIGNGSSGQFGYLGQYFTNAYLMDTNGAVTTNRAGILSPYGDFFPTQGGLAALVTMPDIDSGQQATGVVQVISLTVDANHDGTMDLSYFGPDQTSASKPYVFWNNNNYDRWHTVDGTDSEQDDRPVQSMTDCDFLDDNGYRAIPCTRDLEDYSRLWVNGVTSNLLASLPTGSTVTLDWGDVGSPNSGNPTIDLFQAADSDGGTGYLTNSTIAAQQTNNTQSLYLGRVSPGGSVQLNASQFNNHWAGDRFIWCGAAKGSGKLNLTFADGSSHVLGQASVYIQIKNIKEMYERWTVGDIPNRAPTNTAYLAENGLVPGETKFQYLNPATAGTPYILFVHGWNIELWEKDRYAETAYKRLYWQGYQGRFGSFRWPTGFGFSGIISALTDARNYDNSEFNAWQSATGLLNKLTDLDAQYPGQVYLAAHSMGNVVAGEALRMAGSQLVNTYVAMQGAVPAHCYDALTTTNSTRSVPDRYAYYWTNGAPCYFNGSAGAGAYVNFYNTNDYALGWWNVDQDNKPDNGGFPYPGYFYSVSSLHTNGFYKQFGSGTNDFHNLNFPGDTYDIFAYGAPAWSFALGAQADVGGVFAGAQIDLQTVWPLDTHPQGGYKEHVWHSAEFRSDYPSRETFWKTVLGSDGFNLK